MNYNLESILDEIKCRYPVVECSYYHDLEIGKDVVYLSHADIYSADYLLDQLMKSGLLEECIVCIN